MSGIFDAIVSRSLTCALGSVALAAALASSAIAAEPAGDAAHGAKLFLQCRACHTVAQGDPSGVGPNLWGVVGAKAGARPGYHYSTALSASGIVWTSQTLDQWLTQPTALVPGTNMAFQGVASTKSRGDIIAYLSTLRGKDRKSAANNAAEKPRQRIAALYLPKG